MNYCAWVFVPTKVSLAFLIIAGQRMNINQSISYIDTMPERIAKVRMRKGGLSGW